MRYMMLITSNTYQRPRLGRVDARVDAAAACSGIGSLPGDQYLPARFVVRLRWPRAVQTTLPVYALIGKRARCRGAGTCSGRRLMMLVSRAQRSMEWFVGELGGSETVCPRG